MKNKTVYITYLLFIQFILYASCSNYEVKEIQAITLNTEELTLQTGGSQQLEIVNNAQVTTVWYSDNTEVVTVSRTGLITAINEGVATITADIGSAKAVCKVLVIGTSSVFNLDLLKTPLSEQLIYSANTKLIAPYRVMQGFDIDSSGNIYFIQIGAYSGGTPGSTKAHESYIIKTTPNSNDVSNYMTFKYFGHGSNLAIEETNQGDTYVWLNSNATKNLTSFEYEDSKTISRIKYEPGKTYEEGYAGETFYLGDEFKNTHPAIDVKNRRLTISASQNRLRHFFTYDLDDAMNLSEKEISLELTYGGELVGETPVTETRKIQVKDLRELIPLGYFKIPVGYNKDKDINSHSMQGFDVQGNFIYFNEGDGNQNIIKNGHSNDYVTIFDLNGNIIKNRTAVYAITDLDLLNKLSITDTGYMEGEGLKIIDNKLYLGFASRRNPSAPGGDDYRRANIFVYDSAILQ